MWFKNLTIYRFTKQVDWNAETFEQQLADNAFQACRANDLLQLGWSSPLGKSSPQHLHVAGSYRCEQANRLPEMPYCGRT